MTMISIALQVAGVLSVFTMPGAVWALIGMSRSCQKLEERNGAQAAVIGLMQQRLVDYGDRVLPMTEDTRPRVWPSAAVEAAAWKDAWMRHDASNPADLIPPDNETAPTGTGLAKASQSRPTGLTGGIDGLDENGCARN